MTVNNIYNMQVIYEISSDKKILDHSPDTLFSRDIDYPTFTLGFQHYIHQTKLKMYVTNQFEDKKKIYLVLSQYEVVIDDVEAGSDIKSACEEYFDVKEIVGRTFYKLWEILFLFDIIDLKDDNFTTIGLD